MLQLELLADLDFARMVTELPFDCGDTIVGVGDSFIDDDQSWLEIFRSVLAIHRPQDEIHIVNASVTMQTSTQIVGRFREVLALNPKYILFMLGTNDAQKLPSIGCWVAQGASGEMWT